MHEDYNFYLAIEDVPEGLELESMAYSSSEKILTAIFESTEEEGKIVKKVMNILVDRIRVLVDKTNIDDVEKTIKEGIEVDFGSRLVPNAEKIPKIINVEKPKSYNFEME